MPICIECRYPVPQLYHVSHSSKKKPPPGSNDSTAPAPGGEAKRSSGAGRDVRLTQCPRCKRFADKYVEHDFVVLFIDLVLVKPQVYRHLLFNRLGRDDDAFDPSIVRLGAFLLLFDVYITWSHVETSPSTLLESSPIPKLPILAQYVFYLLLCTAMTLAQHLVVRWLAQMPWAKQAHVPVYDTSSLGATKGADRSNRSSRGGSGIGTDTASRGKANHGSGKASPAPQAPPANANSNAISTAILVSSCMKLFPILMVVWKYDDAGGQLSRYVSWAVAFQNMEALRILMGCAWWVAATLSGSGGIARWLVGRIILLFVGLGKVHI